MALAEIGGHRAAVGQVRRALAQHVDSWTTGVDFGSSDIYAGSVAKALVLAEVTGADPRDFGGVDLVERLDGRIRPSRPCAAGPGQDVGHRLREHARAGVRRRRPQPRGSGRAGSAVRYLITQQCDAGFFRLYFSDPGAADQDCDAAARADRRPTPTPPPWP